MTTKTKGKKSIKKKKKKTKERIRDVALDLFSQKGYNAVSIREIARSANIRESSIYNHYKGKEDIMDSIINYLIELFGTNTIPIEKLLDKFDPEELFNMSIKAMIEQVKTPHIRKILRLMSIELYQNEKFSDFFKNQYIKPSLIFWTQLFQKMMNEGYIVDYDAEVLATEFFNHCLYLFFEIFLINYNEPSFESLIDDLKIKLSNHIKFIFDMVRKNEAEKSG